MDGPLAKREAPLIDTEQVGSTLRSAQDRFVETIRFKPDIGGGQNGP
jgi:hypothetical protein